jgi:hypothetical protein
MIERRTDRYEKVSKDSSAPAKGGVLPNGDAIQRMGYGLSKELRLIHPGRVPSLRKECESNMPQVVHLVLPLPSAHVKIVVVAVDDLRDAAQTSERGTEVNRRRYPVNGTTDGRIVEGLPSSYLTPALDVIDVRAGKIPKAPEIGSLAPV